MKRSTMHECLLLLLVVACSGLGVAAAAAESPHSYPQACLQLRIADGGPTGAVVVGATQELSLPVLAHPGSGQPMILTERAAKLGLQRVACGKDRSVLLLRVLDASFGADPRSMLFPNIKAVQGSIESKLSAVSLADGTSTREGETGSIDVVSYFALQVDSNVSGSAQVDLNRAFQLTVAQPYSDSPFARPGPSVSFAVSAFVPTPATYPDAFGARPLNGRYAGNYFDPNRIGEGIIVEIGDVPGKANSHFLQFSWFSYDTQGKSFWISGGSNFLDGDKRLHMPAAFRAGGRFGGAKPATELTLWGTVDVEFSDCNTMLVDFASNGIFPSYVPTGSGQLKLQRLTDISGYSCE